MQSVTRPSELSHSVCLWKSPTTCDSLGFSFDRAPAVLRQSRLLALARNDAQVSASAAAAADTAAAGPASTLWCKASAAGVLAWRQSATRQLGHAGLTAGRRAPRDAAEVNTGLLVQVQVPADWGLSMHMAACTLPP